MRIDLQSIISVLKHMELSNISIKKKSLYARTLPIVCLYEKTGHNMFLLEHQLVNSNMIE
jgi:hypothetical protein